MVYVAEDRDAPEARSGTHAAATAAHFRTSDRSRAQRVPPLNLGIESVDLTLTQWTRQTDGESAASHGWRAYGLGESADHLRASSQVPWATCSNTCRSWSGKGAFGLGRLPPKQAQLGRQGEIVQPFRDRRSTTLSIGDSVGITTKASSWPCLLKPIRSPSRLLPPANCW